MAVEKKKKKKSGSWRLLSGQYLGEISALCFLHLPSPLSSVPCLIAGSGWQIMVYDLEMGRMVRSFDVFRGIRVHGIICCSSTSSTECADGKLASSVAFEITVFGERRVKMFSLQIETEQQVSVSFTLLQTLPKFANWVLDVSFFKVVVTTLSIYGMSQLLPWFFKFDILRGPFFIQCDYGVPLFKLSMLHLAPSIMRSLYEKWRLSIMLHL